ncbi:MAG: hypothetical protein AAB855_03610 [Patescibacteria group bacterium]
MKKVLTHILAVLTLCALLVAPMSVFGEQLEYDVAINSDAVTFVPSAIFVGEPVRIYASIMNLGAKDITGYVGFYQGPGLLAAPHPFSLKANSVTEDVWIDWTPAEGRYNIMIKIDTVPSDQNPSNNVYLTSMMSISKRPPPPPPPPQPEPQSKPVVETQQQFGDTTVVSTVKQDVTKKAAQKIAEKLTPKLPLNPSSSESQTTIRQQQFVDNNPPTVLDDQSNEIAARKQSGIAGDTLSTEEVATPTAVVPAAPQQVAGERIFAEGIPIKKQYDPARMLMIAGILVAVVTLGAGGYFLKKSRV